jgi:hypothetical protein
MTVCLLYGVLSSSVSSMASSATLNSQYRHSQSIEAVASSMKSTLFRRNIARAILQRLAQPENVYRDNIPDKLFLSAREVISSLTVLVSRECLMTVLTYLTGFDRSLKTFRFRPS